MGFLIVFGYLTLCKCCVFTTVIFCFAPQIIRFMRRARDPGANWQPTSRNILNKMVKQKFKPEEGTETECVICMVDYEEGDEVTPLPCNAKHFFHTECIQNWLKSNNSCPLCKKPVTQEDLRQQRKKKHRRN